MVAVYSSGFPVTVEKRDAAGNATWATTLDGDGSGGCPTLARLLGVTDDGRVGVALPSCPAGTAPGNAWAVTLLGPGGAISSQYVTGIGTVLAMNRFGEVYALSADVGATIPVPDPKQGWGPSGSPFVLRLIKPDGTDTWVDRSLTSLTVIGLHTTSEGGAVISSGAFPPTLVRIDRSGTVLWRADLPGLGAFAVTPHGDVVVTVDQTGVIQYGDAQVGSPGQETRALLVVDADGAPRTVIPLPAPSSQGAHAVTPTALLDGGFVAWEEGSCPHVWAFSADLSPRWDRSVDASCAAQVTSAAATADNLLLTGNSGPADFLSGKSLDSTGYYLLSVQP